MPSGTTRCQYAPVVQLSGDSTHTSDPLRPQVIHDDPQVRRTELRVGLDRSDSLLVANLLSSKRLCTVRIA